MCLIGRANIPVGPLQHGPPLDQLLLFTYYGNWEPHRGSLEEQVVVGGLEVQMPVAGAHDKGPRAGIVLTRNSRGPRAKFASGNASSTLCTGNPSRGDTIDNKRCPVCWVSYRVVGRLHHAAWELAR
jgi:hypothetical protein